MRTARRGKIIWSYMEPGKQAQTIRMIVEDQNASYCFAANIGWYGGATMAKIFFCPDTMG